MDDKFRKIYVDMLIERYRMIIILIGLTILVILSGNINFKI